MNYDDDNGSSRDRLVSPPLPTRSVQANAGRRTPESWRVIPGFSRYEASSRGRVRSFCKRGNKAGRRTITPHLMTPFTRGDGYVQLKLTDDNSKRPTRKLHRLVLLTFLGPPQRPDDTASHMNGVKDDNSISNLAWEALVSNVRRQAPAGSHANKVRGERHPSARLMTDDVRTIRAEYAAGTAGGYRTLARRFGVSHPTIRAIVRRETWRHVS